MDRATTALSAPRGCSFAAADRIKAGFRQGVLTREQAAVQLGDQKRRFDEELALAREYGAKMAEQDQQFRFAADSLVKQDPGAQQVLASRAAQMGTGDYVATAAVAVRSSPSSSADRVAALGKGQRVHGLADPAAAEWRTIVLHDGGPGHCSTQFPPPAPNPPPPPP